MTRIRALVVEDEPDLRNLFCKILNLDGIDTIACEVGEDALDFLSQCELPDLPDFALIDLTLQGDANGELLINRLRSDSKTRSMKIVLMSGMRDLALVAKRVGADGYLRKPFDMEDLNVLLADWGIVQD